MYSKLHLDLISDYFEKINCKFVSIKDLSTDSSLDYLKAIFTAHMQNFPYHNFELRAASNSHPVHRSLTLFNLDAVNQGSTNGGYCFQSAHALFKALRAVGFNVSRSIAKVLNGLAPDSLEAIKKPATHLIVIVTIDNNQFLLDPLLCMNGLYSPCLLKESESIYQENNHLFKIEKINDEFLLSRQVEEKWQTIFCSSFLPASAKMVENQLTKLQCFPGIIGIRDVITLVGIATATGAMSLLWNPKTKLFTLKTLCSQGADKEESFDDFNRAQKLLSDAFKIKHISETQLIDYCSGQKWPMLEQANEVDFPLDENEREKIRANYLF